MPYYENGKKLNLHTVDGTTNSSYNFFGNTSTDTYQDCTVTRPTAIKQESVIDYTNSSTDRNFKLNLKYSNSATGGSENWELREDFTDQKLITEITPNFNTSKFYLNNNPIYYNIRWTIPDRSKDEFSLINYEPYYSSGTHANGSAAYTPRYFSLKGTYKDSNGNTKIEEISDTNTLWPISDPGNSSIVYYTTTLDHLHHSYKLTQRNYSKVEAKVEKIEEYVMDKDSGETVGPTFKEQGGTHKTYTFEIQLQNVYLRSAEDNVLVYLGIWASDGKEYESYTSGSKTLYTSWWFEGKINSELNVSDDRKWIYVDHKSSGEIGISTSNYLKWIKITPSNTSASYPKICNITVTIGYYDNNNMTKHATKARFWIATKR